MTACLTTRAPEVDIADLVQDDKVHSSLYSDPAIFEAELDKVFNNTWVWVGHTSEVPESGSYKTAFIGRQPVIVSRDRKGDIHVMLNRCRHRAATVCEGKRGKVKSFVCPYHGWGYALDGELRAIPKPEEYQGVLDKKDFPLVRLRHETYQGMIFATFNPDIQPLEEHLGGAKKWIDLFMKQSGGYPLKVLGDHRFRFPGNWKIQLENTTDAYHFPVVHKSFVSSLDDQTSKIFDFLDGPGFVEDLGNGHSVMVMIPELVDLDANLDAPIPERFKDFAAELECEGYDDAQVRRLVRAVGGSGFNLNLFPNVACSMAFFRVLRPVAVDETEIHHVAIGGDGAPAAFNQLRMRLHEHFQGPMGFGTPDDAEAWERVQKGSRAGDREWILVNRSLGRLVTSPDGNTAGSVCSETGMRAAYRKYKQMMTA
ncbi:aromatic ring-hydroxylating oxygenase subunit alpha [Azospirillum rugosum]|uniref:Phenylpropionate dioxygenase-like ring-hydroxylating dioxygenase large terminal subunit n=1 Tax=Azospirillum rugosum TaxID=416170 RepID=A0ABS4SKY1_9PROT|nr:aromatic ring-hydroxylating dioxygenase subunit alpha [Azospirillum rugosum]MBP2292748.1 phenylpropionate dioxygenase-like ring-hydroxylating dioxygenase large terminal subunit [Azospirillum rugosum]MDQ0527007.1 phenylpropionate dioxygenase-like ring-hydroxylating dioxygenase large terminal subunit [Azospirillum rugosum]